MTLKNAILAVFLAGCVQSRVLSVHAIFKDNEIKLETSIHEYPQPHTAIFDASLSDA